MLSGAKRTNVTRVMSGKARLWAQWYAFHDLRRLQPGYEIAICSQVINTLRTVNFWANRFVNFRVNRL